MNELLRIYLEFFSSLCSCLFVFRFTENYLSQKIPLKNKLILIIAYFIYSIPAHIPFSALISCLLEILFLFKCMYPHVKKIFITFVKCKLFSYTFLAMTLFLHTFIMRDADTLSSSLIYRTYKSLIVCFLLYVIYVLYTNTKKMKDFHTHYQLSFNLVILSISLMLSYVTLYICCENSTTYALPAIFSTIALLIIVCISLYDKFLALVAENTMHKIQSELDRMEKEYSSQIESNLAELHSIRHDMKNHLIIIDGYATQQNYKKIHTYINKINGCFQSSPLFDTPSSTVSALLNEKYHIAKNKALDCRIHTNFPYVHIDDFSIITILGNLFDNAITAASKCESGWIHVDISQSDSYLEIAMENNHVEKIQEKNGNFISTKEDKNLLHGIGLKNVRQAVDTLNGQISISHTAETFHVNILVPNY